MAKTGSKIDPDRMAVLGRVAERIKQVMQAQDDTYLPEMLMTLPIKVGQQYKQRPLITSIEYALQDVRVGQRGQVIFQFEPVDKQDFEFVDIDQSKIDDIFPSFAPNYGAFLGSDAEDMTTLIGLTELALIEEDKQVLLEKEEAKQQSDEVYQENPLFGAF